MQVVADERRWQEGQLTDNGKHVQQTEEVMMNEESNFIQFVWKCTFCFRIVSLNKAQAFQGIHMDSFSYVARMLSRCTF